MNYYHTRDLPTAALLIASPEIQFHGLEGDNPRSLYFLFSPQRKAERIAMEFVAGKVTINARLYADSLRRSKDVLFENERKEKADSREV